VSPFMIPSTPIGAMAIADHKPYSRT
jgi:hypothetical protein